MLFHYLRLIGLFTFTLLLLVNCSDPLQKTYNPETFSQDLQELEEPDRTIIRNVFDRYERLQGAEEVTGSKTVMLPSLTFGEVLSNYKTFHSEWRESKTEEFKEFFLTKWAEINNPRILISNLTFTLSSEDVKDPDTNYISRLLTIEHDFDRPLWMGGIIGLDLASDNTNIEEIYTVTFTFNERFVELIEDDASINDDTMGNRSFIFPDSKQERYIYNYRIPNEYRYSEDKELNVVGFDYLPQISEKFLFALGNNAYDFKNKEFLLEEAPTEFREEIDKRLDELEIIVQNSFPIDVWPHDSETIDDISVGIINSDLLLLELEDYL